MIVKLNAAEQKLAHYLAKARYENARGRNKPDMKKGPQSNEQTDLEGIASEIAAAKAVNVYPDLDTDLDDLPEIDLLTRSGYSIDVKATTYPNGKLITALWKKDKSCQFYMLVVGKFPKYRIAGIMSANELMRDQRIKNLGHGNTYTAEQAELQSVDEWLGKYG
jgi:hypothetical protein|tara:strand:- start:81 stop:572 length:492 start_codon:yes stop_codon:yes gene_type:complete